MYWHWCKNFKNYCFCWREDRIHKGSCNWWWTCDNDIAKGLEISRESAEHSKIIYGTLNLPFNEKIEINSENFNNKTISRNLLYGIIKPRYEEIFEIIRDHIFDDIYARVSIKSIVITGGASKIYG